MNVSIFIKWKDKIEKWIGMLTGSVSYESSFREIFAIVSWAQKKNIFTTCRRSFHDLLWSDLYVCCSILHTFDDREGTQFEAFLFRSRNVGIVEPQTSIFLLTIRKKSSESSLCCCIQSFFNQSYEFHSIQSWKCSSSEQRHFSSFTHSFSPS